MSRILSFAYHAHKNLFTERNALVDGDHTDDIELHDRPLNDVAEAEPVLSYNSFFSEDHVPSIQNGSSRQPYDHVALISVVSRVYRDYQYPDMIVIDETNWRSVAEGSTFSVLQPSTSSDATRFLKGVIVKRNRIRGKALNQAPLRSFIRELTVLHHLRSHPSVVELRGICWFDDLADGECYPTPGLLLEKASTTLASLMKEPMFATNPKKMLMVFAQITSALVSLHGSGIAHGDMKPDNVLIFRRTSSPLIAKLSDFGSAVLETDDTLKLPGGTKGYQSPEIVAQDQNRAIRGFRFEEISKTDIWSMGLVFAVVICGSEQVLMPTFSLEKIANWIDHLMLQVYQNMGTMQASGYFHNVFGALLHHTLQINPQSRRLDEVENEIAKHRAVSDNLAESASESTFGRLSINLRDVYVNYQGLNRLPGPFRDALVRELKGVAEGDDQYRAAQAQWELGVIYVSQFADPHLSVGDGLAWIRQAAGNDDSWANILSRRLHEAFGDQEMGKDTHRHYLERLEEAAWTGNQIALLELRTIDPARSTNAQAVYASRSYESLDEKHKQYNPYHKAAATGEVAELEFLHFEDGRNRRAGTLANSQDEETLDTPLIVACGSGQLRTVKFLLQNGADPSITNRHGENPLHYACCFSKDECPELVALLLQGGANIDQVSTIKSPADDWDLLPILPGTPMERAAGRGRFDIVNILLQSHSSIIKLWHDGVAQVLFFWALRLHQPESLSQLLLIFNSDEPSNEVGALDKLVWHQGAEERSVFAAISAAAVLGTDVGCRFPVRFWMAAYHGKNWKTAMHQSFETVIKHLDLSPAKLEKSLDREIRWALKESLCDAFEMLLGLKVEKTPCMLSRLRDDGDIQKLAWTLPNVSTSSVMVPLKVYLIDQLFYKKDQGTLAQQVLAAGDRTMFYKLTSRKHYRANLALPMPSPSSSNHNMMCVSPPVSQSQMNVYSVLAYTKHRDMWFANELHDRLKIPVFCPWDEPPLRNSRMVPTDDIALPALIHAAATRFWQYVLWLLEKEASVEERIGGVHDALGAIMASRRQDVIEFFFRGCGDRDAGSKYLPSQYHNDKGDHIMRLFFETKILAASMTWTHHGNMVAESERNCFRYLLSRYPHSSAVEHPASIIRFIFPLSYDGIYSEEESKDFVRHRITLLERSWSDACGYPKQSLRHYFINSPADFFTPSEVAHALKTTKSLDGDKTKDLNLTNFSPSLLWPKFSFLWLLPVCNLLLIFFFEWYSQRFHRKTFFHPLFMFKMLNYWLVHISEVIVAVIALIISSWLTGVLTAYVGYNTRKLWMQLWPFGWQMGIIISSFTLPLSLGILANIFLWRTMFKLFKLFVIGDEVKLDED